MWAVIWKLLCKIFEVINKIIRISKTLQAIQRDGLRGFISSYIIGKLFKFLGEKGIPLDKITDPLGYLTDIASNATQNFLPQVSKVLDQISLAVDFKAYIDKAVKWIVSGKQVANGQSPIRNPSKGSPVILSTGEFERQVTDLVVKGAGIDFEFHRTYHSSALYHGPLGPNWDHAYNLRLRVENDYVVVRLTGQLSEHRFFKHPLFDEDEKYAYYLPPDGVHDVVVSDGGFSFLLRKPRGVTYFYQETAQPGEHRIYKIQDRFGNYLGFVYSNDDRLQWVFINSNKRHVHFDYDVTGNLVCIKDHTGRAVVYQYDDWGYLSCVIGPTCQGEKPVRFERYEYDIVGKALKLARVIDSKGRIIVENEYDADELSDHFGKVIRQRENKGERIFIYEAMADEADLSIPERERSSLKVWEYLRNGHEVEHIISALGNELLTREKLIEGGRIREVVSQYRYNADGEVIAKIDPNGVLNQYLYGRDDLADSIKWDDDFDPVIGKVSLEERMSFGNLLGEVTRGRRIADSGAAFDPADWNRVPNVKHKDADEDIVVKYKFDNQSTLLLNQSDPRFTNSADPLGTELSEYPQRLTQYEYGPAPKFYPLRTILPDRTRPSVLDRVRSITGIVEEIKKFDQKGRPLIRIDPCGHWWFNEYFEEDSPKEGFLRRQLIPHIDWIINRDTPDIIEIDKKGVWSTTETNILSKGGIGDHIKLSIEGARIELYQSKEAVNKTVDDPTFDQSIDGIRVSSYKPYDGDLLVSQNSQVKLRVDGKQLPDWDQTLDSAYIIEGLNRSGHDIEIMDNSGYPISLGRVRTHVPLDYEVDNLGRVIRETDARGNVTLYEYNALGQKTGMKKVPDDNPSVTLYAYDENGHLILENRHWQDENGRPIKEGKVERRFLYDQAGLLLTESAGTLNGDERRGTSHRYNPEDKRYITINPRGVRTHFTHDELNRLIKTTKAACSPDRAVWTTSYDLAGHVQYQRNPRGAIRYNGFRDSNGIWQSRIDVMGRVRIETDPLGHMLVTDFDKLGNKTIVRKFQFREDGKYELLSRRETVYDEHGDAKKTIEAILNSPILTVEPTDLLRCDDEFLVAKVNGNVEFAEIEYHLDAKGRPEAIRNPDDGINRKYYDGQGRAYNEIDALKGKIFRIFDGNGNVVRTYSFDPAWSGSGQIQYYEVFLHTNEYDELNRLIARIDPYGNRWIQKYDSLGNLTCTIDPLGNVVRFEYNAFGEEVKRIQKLTKTGVGGGETLTQYETERQFDKNGNVQTIIDPAKRRTEFRYDALDRLIESWFAVSDDEPHEHRNYDPAGNLVLISDRKKLVKIMKYDLLDRLELTEIDASQLFSIDQLSPLSAKYAEFKYDAAGNLEHHKNEYCVVDIHRDSRGLPISEDINISNIPTSAPGQFKINRQFDKAGRRVRIKYPTDRVVAYDYDYLGRVISIKNVFAPHSYPGRLKNANNTELTRYTYLGRRLVNVQYGNNLRLDLSYDGRGHILDRSVWNGRKQLLRIQSLRDAAGYVRIESSRTANRSRTRNILLYYIDRLIHNNARSRKFFFDSVYQLVDYKDSGVNWLNPNNFKPPNRPIEPENHDKQNLLNTKIGALEILEADRTFDYDVMGNRVKSLEPGSPSCLFTTNNLNQYINVGDKTWIYDATGNLHDDGVWEFSYDGNNAIKELWTKSPKKNIVFYFRDALGSVISEVTEKNIFRVLDGNIVILEIANNEIQEFTVGNTNDSVIHTALGGNDYWITYDGVKSVRLVTDSDGEIISTPAFRPFGEPEDDQLSLSPLKLGYAGMYTISTTPLLLNVFRSYRYDAGRFLQRDPGGYVDNLNLYDYVGNNPVNFIDLKGLQKGIVRRARNEGERYLLESPRSEIERENFRIRRNAWDREREKFEREWSKITSEYDKTSGFSGTAGPPINFPQAIGTGLDHFINNLTLKVDIEDLKKTNQSYQEYKDASLPIIISPDSRVSVSLLMNELELSLQPGTSKTYTFLFRRTWGGLYDYENYNETGYYLNEGLVRDYIAVDITLTRLPNPIDLIEASIERFESENKICLDPQLKLEIKEDYLRLQYGQGVERL